MQILSSLRTISSLAAALLLIGCVESEPLNQMPANFKPEKPLDDIYYTGENEKVQVFTVRHDRQGLYQIAFPAPNKDPADVHFGALGIFGCLHCGVKGEEINAVALMPKDGDTIFGYLQFTKGHWVLNVPTISEDKLSVVQSLARKHDLAITKDALGLYKIAGDLTFENLTGFFRDPAYWVSTKPSQTMVLNRFGCEMAKAALKRAKTVADEECTAEFLCSYDTDSIQDAAEHLAKACDGIERNGLSRGQTVKEMERLQNRVASEIYDFENNSEREFW